MELLDYTRTVRTMQYETKEFSSHKTGVMNHEFTL
jgi:hypothetical protein